ncbi:hypothetical protein WN66_02332 [Saccharomyces cerevisiae]|uniref:Uncharacterized protein n=1 Tax=Saccharomyces cerevisiae (strain AWRI1631) TaxID=545124 RepID=B5VIQ4_YEAS6|nr:hypothetical protein AWRI1631_71820 [Saccharomyces cerevisiae AWRI1631]KZV11157.1 hypothetical protein WN66_02332 [Saccharomyces cerevisiae]
MTLALVLVSNESNFTVNTVFASGLASSSAPLPASPVELGTLPAPAPAAPAMNPPIGMEISGMFNTVFSSLIKLEVSKRVNCEMSCTILEILGSTGLTSSLCDGAVVVVELKRVVIVIGEISAGVTRVFIQIEEDLFASIRKDILGAYLIDCVCC